MFQLTSCEIDDLIDCKRELENVLIRLDAAGAGIAAIHVNAAVEQLNNNLRAVGAYKAAKGPSLIFPEDNQ